MDQPLVHASALYNLKVLHRAYYTKCRLSKIYPNVDDLCDRCKGDKVDHFHMFWACEKLSDYWTCIFKTLNEAFSLNIKPSVEVAIFGVPEHGVLLTNKVKNVIAFATLLARRRILLEWKSTSSPKASMWLCDLVSYLKLEKIKYLMKGSVQNFYKTWQPMITYFEKMKTLPLTDQC